ncbi:ATP-binding protein [Ilumatobacter coccineus]|uniref:Putative anti-sigma factor n=1 Tax=Ilumatobacter coccineus (strain NBRC 103263 / KCTC 29153 / YM16-304) TaxID=1313172 RepID=A0A6C7EGG5_ILUCY|nr:anti-sigma factor [Ilumatobacter coccineus]BAN04075.1 putative anti-sigma factor [Ilumatobacter coccineus YM16-304]
MSESTSADEAIDLVVPLSAAYASTVRLVVAAVGADLEFSVDELDDLRLGVSEVFNLLGDGVADGTRCSTRFVVRDGGVEISMSRDVGAESIELDGLASTILGSVVDEFMVSDGSVILRKRALEAQRS